jgi:hypothetical protein
LGRTCSLTIHGGYDGTSLRHSANIFIGAKTPTSDTSTCQGLSVANSFRTTVLGVGTLILFGISYPPPVTTSSRLHCAYPDVIPLGIVEMLATLWVTTGITIPAVGVSPGMVAHVADVVVLSITFIPQLRLLELPLPIFFWLSF